MKKRLLSILLTLCMVLCLVPTTAFAEGGAKAIQLGTGSIHGYDTSGGYSYIYYGTWRDSPIKWRVLDTKANTGAADALFLLTDECLYPLPGDLYACYIQFNPADKPNRHLWKDSTLQDWFKNTFYSGENSAFTSAERALIPATTQASSMYTLSNLHMRLQICALEAEHVFAPSIQDVMKAAYGFIDSASRIAGPIDSSGRGTRYWLRSFEISEQLPFMVGENASLMGDWGDNPSAVRPAMNLSTAGDNILFISAAEDGKPSGGLAEIPGYTGNEWKLTLRDASRSGFAVTTTNLSAYTKGGTVKIGYTGAKTGANEYVSAMILDATGNPAYYGRSSAALTDENGTAELTIPALAEGTYTLKVFNEQYNGDKMTDLASAFADVTLTVQEGVDEQFSLAPGGRYYFDLSAMNIPGTANSNLPDKTLHYVPFTYVGTVDAYSMENETDTAKQPYEHSLFIADYNVKCSLQRETLAEMNLIYGQTYTASNVNYTLRAPSVGDHHRNEGEGSGLAPIDNEWDTIYQKSADYIKNWYKMRSFGQDIGTGNVEGMYLSRGGDFAAKATFWARPTLPERDVGFRPVLELPAGLAADSLKAVELVTKGRMPGETYNSINIIVKKGESFKAPSAEGLPLSAGISADTPMWWVDENGNYYKPGDTVPADVSRLSALYGGFGLFLDRGDGAVEVTPDNYTDIFGDGTASFVLPKGRNYESLAGPGDLTKEDKLVFYSTGRLEKYNSVFPNLKLKNADLTSVSLSEEYIGRKSPLFVTADGKNTVGSLNGIAESYSTLCVLGNGSLTLNGNLSVFRYTQYGGGSVTMTDGLTAYNLTIDSGSLTVTDDTQALTLHSFIYAFYPGDGMRLFTGSSAQDAAETALPEFSPEVQELYERYLAGDALTQEEHDVLNEASNKKQADMLALLSGKTYVRITNAWDVIYQPGTDGSGDAVTDIKFYNDILTLRGALFTRTGHTQVGWATVDGGEKVYAFGGSYSTDAALTLYPVWQTDAYTITFDADGGSEVAPITQDYGTTITAPEAPTKSGYTFMGWDKEIPATMPAHNMTIKAQWTINQYTITFDTDGGSEVAPITQDYGTTITAPADPTKPGYTFMGWDKEIPATMPAENLTLTAQWTINQYTITFDADGGSEVAPITQDYGTTITAPADPTKPGYTFKGWDKEIPATMPAENLTLTAQWTINQYTITYDLDGGTAEENPDTYTVETDTFTLKNPARRGYTFTGWSGTDLTGEDNLTVTIPNGSTGDRSYKAHWRHNSNDNYCTIKATAGAGGSISPSGDVSVRAGIDQAFIITPDKGYTVSNVKIDGKSIGAVKSYTFENIRRTHTIEVIFMKANSNLQTGVFVDVAAGSYYEDAVDWAVENGIAQGIDDSHFSPDGICTRAQAVTFLWRAAGSPAPETSTMPFTDVPVGSYYYDAVLWAVENGIANGTGDSTFSPDMTCTRAQIVTFLWRSEKSPAAGTANPFADVKPTAYYADAVLWAVKADIAKGTTSTTFSPDADCTRAQIVTFLWRCKK